VGVYTEIAKVPPRSVQRAQFPLKLQMRIVMFLKVGELCLICASCIFDERSIPW
jgi:hypothetical protein